MSMTLECRAPEIVATSTYPRLPEATLLRPVVTDDGEEGAMDVVVARCAGLDVHKDTVVACVRLPGPDGEPSWAEERLLI